MPEKPIIGIDLGTTNSEAAAYINGQVRVLGEGAGRILPSCVGFAPDGALLVGEAARNQYALYPDRTVKSVKRLMGSDTTIQLGDHAFSPQEISAIILRELAARAAKELGEPVERAIITVPAYFSDAQREATREAGKLAGLEVLRILNEPTAASLAYGSGGGDGAQTVLVYDLGGGTFDISIVRLDGNVTEVLASHGDNKLGGDDFDHLLAEYLCREFEREHGVDLREGHATALARLHHAAEEAKCRLSDEPYAVVREEALIVQDGIPLHLNVEVDREQYEELIAPLVEHTFESVTKAMAAAGIRRGDLDTVLLAGGSTRTPLIQQILEARTGLEPRRDIDPDLCVALGAGVMASRQSGHEVDRILVDVTPYSYGISYLDEFEGYEYPHCYHPIIKHNTPLPVTRTESYQTSMPYQSTIKIEVYQGDNRDALQNIPVADFQITGLVPTYDPNVVLCRMNLDLDGILRVTAIEKATGLSKAITVDNVFKARTEEEILKSRRRLAALFDADDENDGEDSENGIEDGTPAPADPAWERECAAANQLLTRCRALLEQLHDDDREEAIDLIEAVEDALAGAAADKLSEASGALRELLFFIEGK